jgi:hypothetical protein
MFIYNILIVRTPRKPIYDMKMIKKFTCFTNMLQMMWNCMWNGILKISQIWSMFIFFRYIMAVFFLQIYFNPPQYKEKKNNFFLFSSSQTSHLAIWWWNLCKNHYVMSSYFLHMNVVHLKHIHDAHISRMKYSQVVENISSYLYMHYTYFRYMTFVCKKHKPMK